MAYSKLILTLGNNWESAPSSVAVLEVSRTHSPFSMGFITMYFSIGEWYSKQSLSCLNSTQSFLSLILCQDHLMVFFIFDEITNLHLISNGPQIPISYFIHQLPSTPWNVGQILRICEYCLMTIIIDFDIIFIPMLGFFSPSLIPNESKQERICQIHLFLI